MKKDSSVVEIRKYSNRRLYDTSSSSYVTLNDVAELIRGGAEIRVVDAKSGEDLTRSVMLQIICESKPQQEALPISFLQEIIQASSQNVRKSLKDFLSMGHQTRKDINNQLNSILRSGAALGNPVLNTFLSIFPKSSEEAADKSKDDAPLDSDEQEMPSIDESSPDLSDFQQSYDEIQAEVQDEVKNLKMQLLMIQEKIEEMILHYRNKK